LSEDRTIEAWIKYKDLEKRVKGDANEVIRELISFISEVMPRLEFISKLTLTVDEEKFLASCSRIMKLTPEGVVITGSTENLTDRELILLHLSKVHFGYITKNLDSDRALIGELITHTKKTAGTVAGRISEMSAEGLVERVGKGEYRITTYGLDFFMNSVLTKFVA
jgi:hypothetical protein